MGLLGDAGPIPIKSRRELESMRAAARHVAEILIELREMVRPGVTTREIDERARRSIRERRVESSFLGYGPHGLPKYPAVICLSVNEEIVHGIPGPRELKEGDILGLDFGVALNGYHGDSAVTVPVGSVDAKAKELMDTTRESLYAGIAQMVPGKRLSNIGQAGHGPRLLPGMVFAIEPMVNAGRPEARMLEDEWTAVTADGSLSAHFEHTALITEDGPEILTRVSGSH